jgi:hypothetical protein
MKISTNETKVMTVEEKYMRPVKMVTVDSIFEKKNTFKYFGCNIQNKYGLRR